MDFVQKTILFNKIAGTEQQFNSRKLCLYIGLVLEEVEELISKGFDPDSKIEELTKLSENLKEVMVKFKTGEYDDMAKYVNRKEIADAGGDIAVVALGTIISNGFDANGVVHEISESNLSKYKTDTGEYSVLKDENGKIMKGPNYFPPSLEQFRID